MVQHKVLYLSRADVESLGLGLDEIVELLEFAFREKGFNRTIMPPKQWIDRGGDRFYSAMTSYIPSLGAAGCKWQSGDPQNTVRGLSYILGLYILNEDETGLPIAIMDSTWITAMRTAAASALTARYLARQNPEVVGILGCGVQGRTNLEALKQTFPAISKVLAYDLIPEVAKKYALEMSERLEVEVHSVPTPRAAVEGADIIITAGPIQIPPRPAIRPDWVAPGALGIALDYDAYWTPDAIAAMDTIVTDDVGQIEHLRGAGFFQSVSRIDAELAEIVAGMKSGRARSNARILAFNLGIAIEDLVTAVELYRRARECGAGTYLPL